MNRRDYWAVREPACCYCGRKCLSAVNDWVRDADDAYHWACIPHVKLAEEQGSA